MVGEIQKAYNVLAGIMRREADDSYDAAEKLREGPLAIGKDMEWDTFVTNNSQMVDPRNPVRQVEHITYPGKDHPAALEVRSGMLERKSKYLKNYTPGWYVNLVLSLCLANQIQVYLVRYTPARVQVSRPTRFSISCHVSLPPRTKAGNTLRARVIVQQVHAQGSPEWIYAPWPLLGFPRRDI